MYPLRFNNASQLRTNLAYHQQPVYHEGLPKYPHIDIDGGTMSTGLGKDLL
jgi:hypothetical protein